jgi:hypothetical protein
MICPTCLCPNPDEALFCLQCGRKLKAKFYKSKQHMALLLFPIFAVVGFGVSFLLIMQGQQKQSAPIIFPSPTPPQRILSLEEVRAALRPAKLIPAGENRFQGSVWIRNQEYKAVVSTAPRGIEAIQILYSGPATARSRKQLLGWASQILRSLDLGTIPDQAQAGLLEGRELSGVFNFFCEFRIQHVEPLVSLEMRFDLG